MKKKFTPQEEKEIMGEITDVKKEIKRCLGYKYSPKSKMKKKFLDLWERITRAEAYFQRN